MVVDHTITEALNRIAENQEEMNSILNRIASHYDGVVPVMTRNAKRAEEHGRAIDEEKEGSFFDQVSHIVRGTTN